MLEIMTTSCEFMKQRKNSLKQHTSSNKMKLPNWKTLFKEIKLEFLQETWQCPGKKSWIKWKLLNLQGKSQNQNLILKLQGHQESLFSKLKTLLLVMKNPFAAQ